MCFRLLPGLSLVLLTALTACHDCTVTVLEEPELFDCPTLNLNIGDTCDDGDINTQNDVVTEDCRCAGTVEVECPALGLNVGDMCNDGDPNTTNDQVDANCVCTGEPVNTCEGELLVMRAMVVNNGLGDLFLDRSAQLPPTQVSFSNLEAVNGSAIQAGLAFPFQFSAVNVPQQRYYYDFQYGSPGVLNPLLLASTDNQFSPTYLLSDLPYAAPVFLNGQLYAIDVELDGTTVNYDILRIDLDDGQPTPLFSGSTTVNSQVLNPLFFSATNGTDEVYFVAGTSFFAYNVMGNFLTHVILEPETDPDRPVAYTGLEYRRSTDELLAIRSEANGGDVQSTLVSISLDGTFMENELAELEGYVLFQDGGILHSTAYANCDETYYITVPVDVELDVFESFLVGIDLPSLTISDARFADFLFGVEVEE